VDSTHGGTGHEGMLHLEPEPHHQLFASEGAIKFPIEPVTAAWTEKVCYYLNYSAKSLNGEVHFLMTCLPFLR